MIRLCFHQQHLYHYIFYLFVFYVIFLSVTATFWFANPDYRLIRMTCPVLIIPD
jgi:hypothetical protein